MTKRAGGRKGRTISVRDANQGFSRLIARVERGERFIVTKNNREVARIEPIGAGDSDAQARRNAALERLQRFMSEPRRSADGWTFKGRREELHDRSL